MSIYFGTDGIRGRVNKELTNEVCYKCGNALASIKPNAKILIGRDTRVSGSYITLAFSVGAVIAGANVIDVGIIPTAGISYLVKKLNYDFGVVISASHNPAEHNGIKIFDENGNKITGLLEDKIEKEFIKNNVASGMYVGSYCQKPYLCRQYSKFLVDCGNDIKGLKIALDCSNGASYVIAKNVFKKLGAKVVKINCSNNGKEINKNCGSLYPEALRELVKREKCDMGFAFDGDSDRIVAVDEKGVLIDGDSIIFILAKYYGGLGQLKNNCVVGTTQTNMGLQKHLNDMGITLIRSDVGDKYVIEKMQEKASELGGEQSGHIIIGKYCNTGDGILAGVVLAGIVKNTGKKLSELAKVELYPQANISVSVLDKLRILNSDKLKEYIKECEQLLTDGRIVVRASGTENKIRVMVEDSSLDVVNLVADNLHKMIKLIDSK